MDKNNFIVSLFIATIGIFAVMYSLCSKPTATMSGEAFVSWVPVDQKDWAVYKDVPNYHFARAKDYLQKGDFSNAAAELKRGNSFLLFQNNRLSIIAKQITVLSDSIQAGRYKDIDKLNAATANAIRIIDDRYAMVPIFVKKTSALNIENSYMMAPVEIKADSVFEEEYNYLFNEAKSKLRQNDRAGAASEIRKASSFLRLEAAYIGQTSAEFDSAEHELNELSLKVDSGIVKDVPEMDRVLQKVKLISFKKEK
jgi:hypothetical protein